MIEGLALERCTRMRLGRFETSEFRMLQYELKHEDLPSGRYEFSMTDSCGRTTKKTISVDRLGKRVETEGSHEDPLVETDFGCLLCYQMDEEEYARLPFGDCAVKLVSEFGRTILERIEKDVRKRFGNAKEARFSVEGFSARSSENCFLTMHVGGEDGSYSELRFRLPADCEFGFESYLANPYVGIQCSYEKEAPEVEEKFIVVGQKGLRTSGDYLDESGRIYESPFESGKEWKTLYASPKAMVLPKGYARVVREEWVKASSVDELLEYGFGEPCCEASYVLLAERRAKVETYGVGKVYSTNMGVGRSHAESEFCFGCGMEAKCLQCVPSGLSGAVMKENANKNDFSQCRIRMALAEKSKREDGHGIR